MISLAAELLEADILTIEDRYPSLLARALSALHGRRRGNRREACLLVCAGPGDLKKILNVPDWRNRFGVVGAWIIDSYWVNYIPKIPKLANLFDYLFVTLMEDVDAWKRATGVETIWLPWGTDALGLGSCSPDRKWDITRVGRQPPEWEDDAIASEAAKLLGVKYRSRPASNGMNTLQNQRLMMDVYADTKYVLAFSNAANPEPYTHPTRQYVTGRWVDGLAAGAILAGVHPKGESVRALLWEEATLDLGTVRREEGLRVLAEALGHWTPQSPVRNHAMALKKLDWRWRFQVVADSFGLSFARLAEELNFVRERITLLGG